MNLKLSRLFYFFLLATAFAPIYSCSDDDDNFTPIELAEGSETIEMGASYDNQVYYDLSSGTATSVPANTWDLAFQSSGGFVVRTNSAKKAGVSTTEETSLDAVTAAPATATFIYDNINLDPEGTAIGTWHNGSGVTLGKVYVINRGNNPPASTNAVGYKKFILNSYASGKYSITYADLDGSNQQTKEITADATRTFTYFSFDDGTVQVEPEHWDIVFTGMTVAGGGPPGSYVVTAGVLSNRFAGVQSAVVLPSGAESLAASDDPAADINTFTADNSQYEAITQADFVNGAADASIIGKSWWQILQPHANGVYKVYDWKTYIVKDEDDRVYKLKFNTFKGGPDVTVGYPSFEYKELE